MLSDEQIEAEAQRAAALVRRMLSGLDEKVGRDDVSNLRLDQVAVIGVLAWDYDDGDTGEAPCYQFETKAYHRQLGIMQIVQHRLLSRIYRGDSDD